MPAVYSIALVDKYLASIGGLSLRRKDGQRVPVLVGVARLEDTPEHCVVAHVRATDYFPRLSKHLFEAYRPPSDRLTLRVHAEPIWLAVPTAIPCGLIITELVTNSFKHAFPNGLMGEIHIILRQDSPGTSTLIVGDTGVGLPEGLDVHATKSLGWQLVRILTEQLRGTIALEEHGGTTVAITFPL
jgi:two-component sensor histidine kinase